MSYGHCKNDNLVFAKITNIIVRLFYVIVFYICMNIVTFWSEYITYCSRDDLLFKILHIITFMLGLIKKLLH